MRRVGFVYSRHFPAISRIFKDIPADFAFNDVESLYIFFDNFDLLHILHHHRVQFYYKIYYVIPKLQIVSSPLYKPRYHA